MWTKADTDSRKRLNSCHDESVNNTRESRVSRRETRILLKQSSSRVRIKNSYPGHLLPKIFSDLPHFQLGFIGPIWQFDSSDEVIFIDHLLLIFIFMFISVPAVPENQKETNWTCGKSEKGSNLGRVYKSFRLRRASIKCCLIGKLGDFLNRTKLFPFSARDPRLNQFIHSLNNKLPLLSSRFED
jgi:hypothetical protein